MGDYYCLGGPPGAEIGVLREAVDLPFWRFSGTRSSPERFFIQRSRKKHTFFKIGGGVFLSNRSANHQKVQNSALFITFGLDWLTELGSRPDV